MNLQQQMDLQQQFEAAVARVDGLPEEQVGPHMTELYGLYKQATQGDHDTQPDTVDTEEHDNPDGPQGMSQAQWDSWSKYKGMSEEAAKRHYLQRVEEIAGPLDQEAVLLTGSGQPATPDQVTDQTAHELPSPGTEKAQREGPGISAGGLRGNLNAGAPYGGEDELKTQQ
jgi:acyl-CoA-binding protein